MDKTIDIFSAQISEVETFDKRVRHSTKFCLDVIDNRSLSLERRVEYKYALDLKLWDMELEIGKGQI